MKLVHLSVFAAALGCASLWGAVPKYVFLFIGDGMSTPQRMTAEEFSRAIGRGQLAMNNLPSHALTRTRSANSLVTDSAASATAIACGAKANNGTLGLTPDGQRLESVAAVAKRTGKKVGVMTTVTIVHATPGGFYAHRKSRGDSYGIALDLVDSGFDLFAGGGVYSKYDDRKHAEYKGNVFDLAAKAGYRIVRDRQEWLALGSDAGKTWGVFNDDALDFAIDNGVRHPLLKDLVAKAIELLDNPNGFFIMAEGGKIDYAGHANDAATNVRELISTDDAVKVALEFAAAHPAETLVMVTGDHETGGMAMGFAGTGYTFHVNLLGRQKCSTDTFSRLVAKMIEAKPDCTFADVRPLVAEKFGFLFDKNDAKCEDDKLMVLSTAEIKELEKAFAADRDFVLAKKQESKSHDVKRKREFAATCKRLISNHAGVGWTTGAHTALPTMTTSVGCGAERFTGMLENCDISLRLKDLLQGR